MYTMSGLKLAFPKAGAMDIKTKTATPIKPVTPQVTEQPGPDRTALWVSLGFTVAGAVAAAAQGTMAAAKAKAAELAACGPLLDTLHELNAVRKLR